MHGTTSEEYLLQALLPALSKLNLPLDKLCGVAIDGAPAMVGTRKRLVSLLKKEINAKGIRHEKLIICYCIVVRNFKFCPY